MHTGDLAVMREDGYVNITGRIKDMIIRGGENVYPREVEEFLYMHPESDGRAGDRSSRSEIRRRNLCVGAPAGGDSMPPRKRFRDFCRGQIATYKIPRYIRFSTEFPTTVTGKVQKYRMRRSRLPSWAGDGPHGANSIKNHQVVFSRKNMRIRGSALHRY